MVQRRTTTGYTVQYLKYTYYLFNVQLYTGYSVFFSVSLPSLGSGIIESGSGPAFYAAYPSGSILGFYDHKLKKNFLQKLQFIYP
jgi:hypothetical protein